jgi:hypothetical protein
MRVHIAMSEIRTYLEIKNFVLLLDNLLFQWTFPFNIECVLSSITDKTYTGPDYRSE